MSRNKRYFVLPVMLLVLLSGCAESDQSDLENLDIQNDLKNLDGKTDDLYCESDADCDGKCEEMMTTDMECICDTKTNSCEIWVSPPPVFVSECTLISTDFYIEENFIYSKTADIYCEFEKIPSVHDPEYYNTESGEDITEQIEYVLSIMNDSCARDLDLYYAAAVIDVNGQIYSCDFVQVL